MPRSQNPITFAAPEQLGLALSDSEATDAELIANFKCFDVYFVRRRADKRPTSLETLAKERVQWNALCKHFISEKVRADLATETTFRAFFASEERRANHIRNHVSYLRLYNNVMYACARAARDAALATKAESADGPVEWNQTARQMMDSPSYRFADMKENKRPPVFLSAEADQRLRDHLFTIPEEGKLADLRTFVLMAVIRGSGASPGEIRTLQLDEIDRDGHGRAVRLRMYGRSGNEGHVYALEDFARRALSYWLLFNERAVAEGRAGHGFPEVQHPLESKWVRFVFPNLYNTRDRYGQAIDADTATRSVKAALKGIGIRVKGSITQVLRTQYATTSLRDGDTPEELVDRMGYYDHRSLDSYVAIVRGQRGEPVPLRPPLPVRG